MITTHPQIAKEWDYIKNGDLTPQQITKGYNKKVWWLCSKGHSYNAKVCERTYHLNGCPICSNKSILKGYNDLATICPQIVKEWDYEKNYPLTPQQVTTGTNKKVWWLCDKKHSYLQNINHKINRNQGCPYCSGRIPINGESDLVTTHSYLLKEWDFNKNNGIKPQDFSYGSSKKVWWLCKQGHSYQQVISKKTTRNDGCPYCSGSKTERLLYDLLKQWNIPFKAEKKFEHISVKFYPFDIYISSLRLIIEADGMQHFKYINEYFEQDLPFET